MNSNSNTGAEFKSTQIQTLALNLNQLKFKHRCKNASCLNLPLSDIQRLAPTNSNYFFSLKKVEYNYPEKSKKSLSLFSLSLSLHFPLS